MTSHRELIELQTARAEMYLFFAGVFRNLPTEEFIQNLLSHSGIEIFETLFPDHHALAEFRELAAHYQIGNWSLENFRMDFENLMRIPGDMYVHPFESVYREMQSHNRNPRKTMLMGKEAREVARIYQAEGLSPVSDNTLFPDELSVELEFMGRLCRRAAKALEADEAEHATEILSKQEHFLKQHLLQWAGTCLEKVVSNSDTGLYRVLAKLLAAFLEQEKTDLPGLNTQPLEGAGQAVG